MARFHSFGQGQIRIGRIAKVTNPEQNPTYGVACFKKICKILFPPKKEISRGMNESQKPVLHTWEKAMESKSFIQTHWCGKNDMQVVIPVMM